MNGEARLGNARRGVALVAALALLALSAALLAAACLSARALERNARSLRASADADALARRAVAQVAASWDPSLELLPVGGSIDREISTDASTPAAARARIVRLGSGMYAAVVDARVGAGPTPLAHRRYRLLLERPITSDSLRPREPPRPIRRWSFGDIY